MRRILLALSLLVAAAGSAAPLTYSVTPSAVAYTHGPKSVVSLKIVAICKTAPCLPAPSIVFVMPVGSANGDLLGDADIWQVAPTAPKGWTIAASGDGSFQATPPERRTIRQGDTLAFTFSGIVVNTAPGMATIEIYDGNPPHHSRVFVAKVPSVARTPRRR